MDRRTYLQAAGGLATLGLGDGLPDLSDSSDLNRRLVTNVAEPELYGYGGRAVGTDGGTPVVAGDRASTDTAPSGEPVEHAAAAPSGERVRAELDAGGADWYVLDADRNDPIHLTYDGTDAGTTALFLYGPDGELRERVSADRGHSEVLFGVADSDGTHLVQAVDAGRDGGEYILDVRTGDLQGSLDAASTAGQSPYGGTARTVPGTVQAQHFDEGGEGVAYHDTTDANRGGAFRTGEGVDIAAADDASGEYNIGYVDAGEWLEYTVDVTPGTYTLRARVASAAGGGQFSVSLDGQSLGTIDVPDTGGWQRWQTVTVEGVDIATDGTGVLRVDAETDGFNFNWLRFESQRPYGGTPRTVPGTIQAQHFDEGGEGIAYHDTTDANRGGAFRTDEGVDIAATADASGEYNIGYTDAGEWLEYTVDVTPGTYTLRARVASATGEGQFSVSLDGQSLGTIDIPDTGGWQSWQTVSLDGVDVSASGSSVLRVDAEAGGFTLNWVGFEGQRPYGGTPRTVPGTIQAQHFDEGGEGIAYHDTTGTNQGGTFRPDEAVDIAATADASGEYNIGYTDAGEWLEYTVDVTPGTYSLRARVASATGEGQFSVSLDGQSLGTIDVPDTGGWQRWQTVTVENVDVSTDGTGVLRVDAEAGGFTLNWVGFEGQRPYGGDPQVVPGTVQVEMFDEGGEGVAYHDTTGTNQGGTFRPDEAVDIAAADDGANEFNVGYPEPGEWLEYTVDATPGTYDLEARVASADGGGFSVSLDGQSLGTIDVPDTGGWQNWQTVTIDSVDVGASGTALLRVDAETNGFNLNWLSFRTVDDESYGEQGYGDDGYGGTS